MCVTQFVDANYTILGYILVMFKHTVIEGQTDLHIISRQRCKSVDPLSYFSFQPVLHDWCNKGRGVCYPACEMMHIKEPLLLIGKSSPCDGSGFPHTQCGPLP